jgi:transcriptional antiterminator NusG
MDDEPEVNPTQKKRRTFRLGDKVRILSGPFAEFTGKIEGINQSKALVKVNVVIYGRKIPIKLHFADIEVVSAL